MDAQAGRRGQFRGTDPVAVLARTLFHGGTLAAGKGWAGACRRPILPSGMEKHTGQEPAKSLPGEGLPAADLSEHFRERHFERLCPANQPGMGFPKDVLSLSACYLKPQIK